MEQLEVQLGQRSYPIEIGEQILQTVGEKLAGFATSKQVAVVSDEQVYSLYGSVVLNSLQKAGFFVKTIVFSAGEQTKSWNNCEKILTTLLEENFHRDCNVIALGGGVIGDLAGFAASIYQRGVDFYQIPTSLLAQVDSSVGGKVAVNHSLGKNMIGSFYQPKAVWIDLNTLDTLEQRHWLNGLAEVIKYGVIFDDDFFLFLQKNSNKILQRDKKSVAHMIAACCKIKANVVAKDEREGGQRAKLNFGHTIGHGVELAGHYGEYYHGEAVAIGMALASQYAMESGICSKDTFNQIVEIIKLYQLPCMFHNQLAIEEIIQGIQIDKKVQNGQWVFVLPTEIGKVEIIKGIDPDKIEQLLYRKVGE